MLLLNKILWYLIYNDGSDASAVASSFPLSESSMTSGLPNAPCCHGTGLDSVTRNAAPRSRRRGDALEAAILEAAWAELEVTGYTGLRVDAVAERAKTSKTVLYRRWPSRAELVLATLRKQAAGEFRAPNTGSLRKDVVRVLQWLSDRYRAFPEIVRGLMVELPESAGPISQTSAGHIEEVLARAVGRGDVDPALLTERVVRMPLELARYQMFVSRKPLSKRDITEIVDDIFIPLVRPRG
jgi:AcrR family transcriptional regulator